MVACIIPVMCWLSIASREGFMFKVSKKFQNTIQAWRFCMAVLLFVEN